MLLGTLAGPSPAALTDDSPVVLGDSPAPSDAWSPLSFDDSPATTPCCGVPLSTAAAVNPVKSAGAGRTTNPLDCLSGPLTKDTLMAYSAIPEKASLFRNSTDLTVVLRISSACRSTFKSFGMPGASDNVVTNEFSRRTNSVCEPASQAVTSAVQTREASHTVPAPRLPWVVHGRSSNLVVVETRVAVAQFGRGSGGTTAVGVARGADVVTGEAAAAPVSRGCPLAADRVVRVDENIAEQSSGEISSPQFFSLLVRGTMSMRQKGDIIPLLLSHLVC